MKSKLRAITACALAALLAGTTVAVSACTGEGTNAAYTLTYASASVAGGTVSGAPASGSKVAAGTTVTLTAAANAEYSFTGWYEAETAVSTEASYSFSMPAKDYSLTARFEENNKSYVFTYESSDDTMGTVESEVRSGAKQKTGTQLTVTAAANAGYDFLGWFSGENSVSANAEYTFSMPANDYALTAKFAPTPIPKHTVTYISADTSLGRVAGYANDNVFASGTALEEGTPISLEAMPQSGYAFAGWYHDAELVSSDNPYDFTLGEADVNLTASFVEDVNSLTIVLDGEAEGCSFTISANGETLDNGAVIAPSTPVTVTAVPKPIERDFSANRTEQDGYVFLGWYEHADDDAAKGMGATWSFRMPSSSYTLHAKFVKAFTYTAKKPTATWPYVTLGSAPQSLKTDDVTIVSATPDALGYYAGSDGAKYIKLAATPNEEGLTFHNGTTVTAGQEYYFKVEPIKWRVLEERDGKAFLMADIAVENMPFQSHVDEQPEASYVNYYGAPDKTYYANNYQYSEVRYWLNHDFLTSAFSGLPLGVLTKFVVNNEPPAILQLDGGSFYCENTRDYVALMSVDELLNKEYGFSEDYLASTTESQRQVNAPDYAIARGVFYFDEEGYVYHPSYWTRTAGVMDTYSIGYVETEQVILCGSTGTTQANDGVIDMHRTGPTDSGVVPCLWLEFTAANDGLTLYNPDDLDYAEDDPAADFVPSALTSLKAELAAMLPVSERD